MELEKTKIGLYTLKIGNKYIHSKYDPIKEAKEFVKANIELVKNKIVLVYGLGLGYHINAIEENIEMGSIIYVFEWNNELVKFCQKVNKEIFEKKNIKIIGRNDSNFYSKLAESLDLARNIIIHRPSLETIKELNRNLYDLIYDFSLTRQMLELNKDSVELYDENYNINIKGDYTNILKFINEFKISNKDYIVVSAGSSLDSELNLLKKYKCYFNIFCVGSAFRTLMKNGIKPDGIFIIDGHEIIKNQFIGFENENIPLCFSANASIWAVGMYNGPKYIFNVDEKDELYIRTGGTVAVATIDIAIKCEAKKIVLLGQDLAFVNGKNHIEEYKTIHNEINEKKYKIFEVEGVDGNFVKTNQVYYTFKNKIESLVLNNKNVEFVNCSKGANIRGTRHIKFEEYIQTQIESKMK